MSINKTQLTLLVNTMVENPNIGKGFQKENKEKVLAFWKKLHDSLNSMGPPSKSISDWKKVWIDQKRYVRKKAVQNAQNRKKTGGGPCKEHVFYVLEQSILDLTATIESVEGVEGGKTFGLQPTTSIGNKQSERDRHDEQDDLNEGTDVEELSFLENIDCENIVEIETENTTPALKPKRKTQDKINPSELLSMELSVQKEISVNISKGLEMRSEHYKEMEHQLQELKEGIENFAKNQDHLLTETKRHHLEIERLRKVEVERKLVLINSQIEVQKFKILAAKRNLNLN